MYALLIAEDPDDVAFFSLILQRAGLTVTTNRELERAMQGWVERPADLALLALSAPSPQEQVRRVRAETLAPLILSLNSNEEGLHCELLRLGADLVVAAPLSPKLLIAQIAALMRRAGNAHRQQAARDPGAGGAAEVRARRKRRLWSRQPGARDHRRPYHRRHRRRE